MKCQNPSCGSLAANEINISLNITETAETEEIEYTGTTDYGDPSDLIGTYCYECEEMTYVEGWHGTVLRFIDGTPDKNILDMRQSFHDFYGTDNEAALHAAYDLVCYLEQKGMI